MSTLSEGHFTDSVEKGSKDLEYKITFGAADCGSNGAILICFKTKVH